MKVIESNLTESNVVAGRVVAPMPLPENFMAQHMAVAMDFCEVSKSALRGSFALARVLGAHRITVMHAVQKVVLPDPEEATLLERMKDLRHRILDAAHVGVEKMSECEEHSGIDIDYDIVEGAPIEAVPHRAKQMGVSLLMTGTHARRGLPRLLRGSVAEGMIQRTDVPIMVLPQGEKDLPPHVELQDVRHIVIATSLHAHSSRVVEYGLMMARSFRNQHPKITILTVVEPGLHRVSFFEAKKAEYEAELTRICAASELPDERIDHHVEIGHPHTEIVRFSERVGARLIILGRQNSHHHRVTIQNHILRNMSIPLLVVPNAT